jgi:hypothetical protein
MTAGLASGSDGYMSLGTDRFDGDLVHARLAAAIEDDAGRRWPRLLRRAARALMQTRAAPGIESWIRKASKA